MLDERFKNKASPQSPAAAFDVNHCNSAKLDKTSIKNKYAQ